MIDQIYAIRLIFTEDHKPKENTWTVSVALEIIQHELNLSAVENVKIRNGHELAYVTTDAQKFIELLTILNTYSIGGSWKTDKMPESVNEFIVTEGAIKRNRK